MIYVNLAFGIFHAFTFSEWPYFACLFNNAFYLYKLKMLIEKQLSIRYHLSWSLLRNAY